MDAFIAALPEEGFDTLWLSDGLAREGRDRLTEALGGRGLLSVVETPREVLGLRPAVFDEGLARVARATVSGGVGWVSLFGGPRTSRSCGAPIPTCR